MLTIHQQKSIKEPTYHIVSRHHYQDKYRIFATKKAMNKKLDYDYCLAAPILEWMSHKWALVVLLRIKTSLSGETNASGVRFSDLFRTIPHISEKMLASTLSYLEHEGLVVRTSFNSVPPRVEYSLSPLATDFLREIDYVIEWGHLHFEEILKCRQHQVIAAAVRASGDNG